MVGNEGMQSTGLGFDFKPINIFLGALGSGKTEVAINTSLLLLGRGKVALVDLDIVNPFFRTRAAKDRLAQAGLDVICPPRVLAQADAPALVPSILSVLTGQRGQGVLDVGGDEVGATVLGSLRTFLRADQCEVFFVVNPFRPSTRTAAQIGRMMTAVEQAARLRISYMVNNTNLGSDTDLAALRDGRQVVAEAAALFGRPVAFAAVRNDLVRRASAVLDGPVLGLHLYMRPPWDTAQ